MDDGFQSLLPVALYGNDTGLLPIRPARLEKLTLRVVLVKPSNFVSFNDTDGEVSLKDCFLKELMKYLSQRLHFRCSYLTPQQNDCGRKEGNDWSDAIGLVIRGEADMIPFMPIMSPAHDVIAYTKPIAFTTEGMLVSLPRPSRAFMFFRFYQIEVWISLLSTVLVITYVLRQMFRFHVGIEMPVSLPSCFWLIFGSLLQQGNIDMIGFFSLNTNVCKLLEIHKHYNCPLDSQLN
ncbi:hypothetical protein AVEN_45188-1 [Araneus ventricosus]|uniref:Ionotropic glutamate receptor L-glutamate and glycine-binding domain-containing protein n=1 Tax=Araneus ventricosus TaxID=182803 RepID=A0A4Y2NGC3_ARAVE|nr:hypothetical protein AVEN_45188-1 [Araneus ventricosus]